MTNSNYRLGFLVLRLALGLNIFLHGAGRMGSHYEGFVNGTVAMFSASALPEFLVEAFTRFIPIGETVVGALILIGLCTRMALMIGSFIMMGLITGMCILQKWDTVGLQMMYLPFYAFLLYRLEDNSWALDHAIGLRGFIKEMASERE